MKGRKKYDFNLVVVWQEKPGVYKTELVERISEGATYTSPPDFSPPTIKQLMTTGIYIDKHPPGKITDVGDVPEGQEHNKGIVLLENPGIEFVYCEKSSVVYYWDKKANRFEYVVTSD